MPQNQTRGRCVGRKGRLDALVMRAALGAALAGFAVCANTAIARAGDDGGSDDQSIYAKFMHTLGLRNPGTMEYGIDYNERSPLVVPPTRDLPPPVASAPPPVPDWPKDADVKKRNEAKAQEKPAPHADYVVESSRPLRPDELNVGRPGTPNEGQTADNSQPGQPAQEPKKSIFNFDWLKKEQYATFTGEPARSTLTDPPPGYLTPSPDEPYGITDKHGPAKQPTLAEHGELQR